jgi:hypothetical protein
MTGESARGATINNGHPTWMDGGALYYFAVFISGSSSWRIIDSWSGTIYNAPPTENTILGRYVGDPIGDAIWADWTAVGHGGGIVIEQKNPRPGYPPLQHVWQFGGSSTLGYISGHTYRDDNFVTPRGTFRSSTWRIGMVGGWDFDATRPDFADPTKASDTCYNSWANFGGGSNYRTYYSADDDWICVFEANDTNKDFFHMSWFGQYNVKNPTQESIAAPAYGMLCDTISSAISPDGYDGGKLLCEVPYANQMFQALDENGVAREWSYQVNPGLNHFLDFGSTNPTEFDPTVGIDLYEIVIRGRASFSGYDDRLIGSLRGIYAATRIGNGGAFDSAAFLCLGSEYGVIVEWDGSTAV